MSLLNASSSPRENYHHGELAKALKSLSVAMIAERGVEGFSMRDAAHRLGVAPSAVYRHFADKAELLGAVALDGFKALGERWLSLMSEREAESAGDPAWISVVRFSAGADAYFRFAVDHPAWFQLMFGPYGTGACGMPPAEANDGANPYAILSNVLDGMLAAGVLTPETRPDAEIKAWAAIHGAACLIVSGVFRDLDAESLQRRLQSVKDNIFAGLVAGTSSPWFAARPSVDCPPSLALTPGPAPR
jgi:AcrR family transcriptional regulator